jgi:Ca2+-binding EF-hand superfamily protein
MRAPAFLLLLLAASAAEAQVSPTAPITVTAHPWAPFISPMGEAFRPKTRDDDTLADWFAKADRNRDGFITADEMVADAERFFATLDTDHDGQILPDELAAYEYQIAPEIQVNSKTKPLPGHVAQLVRSTEDELGGDDQNRSEKGRRRKREDYGASLGIGGVLQGAARYSLLNMPEPVAAADADFNRAITLDEFRQAALARFQLLDKARQGRLTLAQFEAMPHAPADDGSRRKRKENETDARIGNPLPSGP